MDPLDALFESPAEVVSSSPQDELRRVEDQLLVEHMKILRDVARAREIDPAADTYPLEWLDEMSEVEAQRTFRLAQAAWCPPKTAPVLFKLSAQVATGILKAKAAERSEPRALNLQIIQMVATDAPEPAFPRLTVKK